MCASAPKAIAQGARPCPRLASGMRKLVPPMSSWPVISVSGMTKGPTATKLSFCRGVQRARKEQVHKPAKNPLRSGRCSEWRDCGHRERLAQSRMDGERDKRMDEVELTTCLGWRIGPSS
jgi:hypothetical protein